MGDERRRRRRRTARLLIGCVIALALAIAVWVSWAHGGVSPIGTPGQMFYLRRKLAHTTRIEITNRYPSTRADGVSRVVTDKRRIDAIVRSLLIPRMTELCPGDPPWIRVTFYSRHGDPFAVGICEEPPRLLYRNPWKLEAPIPPRFLRLVLQSGRFPGITERQFSD